MPVVELKPRPKQVVASVVETLEGMLERARAGDITGLAAATVNYDGSISSTWSETDNFPALLGSVARLEYRLNANQNVE